MVSSRRPVGLDVNAWMYVSLLLFFGSVLVLDLWASICDLIYFYLCIVLDQAMVSSRRPLVLDANRRTAKCTFLPISLSWVLLIALFYIFFPCQSFHLPSEKFPSLTLVFVKGSLQNKFLVKVGNLAQPAWPPPSPNVGIFSVNFSEIFGKKGSNMP